MNFTIFYEEEGYRIYLPRLMGRNAAGASFLEGLFANAASPNFSCLTRKAEHSVSFTKLLSGLRHDGNCEVVSQSNLVFVQVWRIIYPVLDWSASHHRLSACSNQRQLGHMWYYPYNLISARNGRHNWMDNVCSSAVGRCYLYFKRCEENVEVVHKLRWIHCVNDWASLS